MQIIGNQRIYLDSTDSTNTFAQQLVSKSNPIEGTVISAGFQTAGKGQGSNKWQSEAKKNILLSLILYPDFLKASKQFYLSIFTANAIVSWLNHIIPEHPVRIKWPNDIYVGHQKLGGMLIQNTLKAERIEHTVIGIGLNILQKDFDAALNNPVSLTMLTGQDHSPEEMLNELLMELDKYYLMLKNGNFTRQKADFEEKLLFKGENTIISTRQGLVEGIVLGVAEDGRIILNVGGVVRKLAH